MNQLNRFLTLFFLSGTIALLSPSCGSEEEIDENEADSGFVVNDDSSNEAKEEMENNARKVLRSIPSPSEVIGMVSESGANYRDDLLNKPENASAYVTSKTMALNLGVYGADLSYCSIFKQTQQSIFYLSSCEKMAKGIGISKAFDANSADRINDNINDKDSILQIISDNFWASNNFLEENEKHGIASLIVAGGWIEVLHIATSLIKDQPNETIRKRIAEQKLSLENMVAMLEAHQEDADITETLNDLKELKKIFNKVSIEYQEAPSTLDEETGITVINTTSTINMDDEVLMQITEKVAAMRSKIVTP